MNILIIKSLILRVTKYAQNAFTKYGLNKFNFIIFEYFTFISKIISNKSLTDLDTKYISLFKFSTLYNFKTTATSMQGYKHTEEARLKMIEFFLNKLLRSRTICRVRKPSCV